jgi:ADP-heptose:LPS heptosyltransferase
MEGAAAPDLPRPAPRRGRMRKGAILNWLVYRYACARRRVPTTAQYSVGIFKPDRIGDFVLCLPTIRLIIDKHGPARCVLFHSDAVGDLVAEHFPEVKAVGLPVLSGRLWSDVVRLGERLKKHPEGSISSERMYCLRHYRSLQDELMLLMLPAMKIVTVRNSPILGVEGEIVRRRFEGDDILDRPSVSDEGCDDLRCHSVVLGAAVDTEAAGADVRPKIARDPKAGTNHLVVAPFGSVALRDLPSRTVKAVIEYCHAKHGLVPVALSPKAARKRHDDYFGNLHLGDVTVGFVETESLSELQDELGKARLVFSTETGTAHIAAALDCRLVALLGGGNFGLFAPWANSPRQQWVYNRTPCYHCNWYCNQEEVLCLTTIQKEKIFSAVDAVLGVP